jgi:hypothetical protein
MFRIRVVNPTKGKTVARGKNGRFKKGGGGGSRRRRRRRNPEAREENPRPRRRRRRNPTTTSRRRRRRRNPEGGGGSGWGFSPLKSFDFKDLAPAALAWFVQSWVVRRWGDNWGTSLFTNQVPGSPYRGQAWTFKNYVLAFVAAWGGAKLIARSRWGAGAARIYFRSSIESMAQRML